MCACVCGDEWWMVAVSSSAGRRDGATMGARAAQTLKPLSREVFAVERLRGGCRRRLMARGVCDACVRVWCVY